MTNVLQSRQEYQTVSHRINLKMRKLNRFQFFAKTLIFVIKSCINDDEIINAKKAKSVPPRSFPRSFLSWRKQNRIANGVQIE